MRILHIAPYVPSIHANHAGGVCMGKQVESLMENNDVHLLCFVNEERERKLIKEYDNADYVTTNKLSFAFNAVFAFFRPNLFGIRSSVRFSIKLIHLIRKYNIEAIHAEYTAMGQYVWIKRLFPNLKFNITEHDVTIQSFERLAGQNTGLKHLYYDFQRKLVRKKESKYLYKADTVFTFNEKDKSLLDDIYGIDAKVLVPYYGIDFYSANADVNKVPNSICFVGQMGRDENHIAAMRLVSLFKEINNPAYHLTIIGAHPRDELLKEEATNIHITGFVEDINKEILKNEVAVFPLTFGAGIKLKVLLAFGLGLPVITTSIGAEGIDEEGKILILAEDDEEIKKAIVQLLSNKKELKDLSNKEINFVKDNFNWEKSRKLLNEVYNHQEC